MIKSYISNQTVLDLHTVSELQKITIRKDVILVPLNRLHASRLLEIIEADKNIRNRVTVASRLFTVKDVEAEINQYLKDPGLIRYIIEEKDNPVGLVSLWRDDGFFGPINPNDYGFGYFLEPNSRGKGLVSSAIESLINVMKIHLPIRQFVAFCEPDNMDSINVLTKLGFKPTGEIYQEPNTGWKEEKYIRTLE